MEMEKFVIKKLGDGNYATWCTDMKWILIGKDLWAAADPDVEQAAEQRTDMKAKAIIGLCVEQHLKPIVDESATARDAWAALQALYRASSIARRLQLKRELNSLHLKHKESLTAYIARASAIRDELAGAGHAVTEEEVVMGVLSGLPSCYEALSDSLETGGDELTLAAILPKLMIVEQRTRERMERETSVTPFEPSGDKALAAAGITCWYCNKPGHIKRDCHKRKVDLRRAGASEDKVPCLVMAI